MSRLLAWFWLLLLAACASQPTQTTSERLLAEPPPGWQLVYQFNNVETRLSEFVPPDETQHEWSTKVVFESHGRLATKDPIEIIMAEVKRLQESCSFVQHFNLFSGFENGYPTSARLIMCGENEPLEKGEVSIFKSIQGNDYMYVVRIFRRIPPFEVNQPEIARDDIATWSSYISKIHLCEPGSEQHPCPEGN